MDDFPLDAAMNDAPLPVGPDPAHKAAAVRMLAAALVSVLAEANAKTGLFKRRGFLMALKRRPEWLARVPKWARGALVPDGDGDGGYALNASLKPGGDEWLYWCPGEEKITVHGQLTPSQLRDLADMMDPAPPAVLHLPPMSDEQRAELLAAWQAAPGGSLVVPDDPRDAPGRAVIEAAREWFAADMDTDAQAGDRLSAAVRAYESAHNVEQRENDDAV